MHSYRFGICFIISLGILCILQFILPANHISTLENRPLTQAPDFSLSSWLRQSYQDTYENYRSDQFFLRSGMTIGKHRFDQLLGAQEIQGVLVGKREELYQMPANYNIDKIEKLAQLLTEFSSRYQALDMNFLLVPNKGAFSKDAPSLISSVHPLAQIDDFYQRLPSTIKKVDAISVLADHQEELLYYHSDHHWTSYGAYVLAQEYLRMNDMKEESSYTPIIANDAFYGTLANATGFGRADTIELYQRDEGEVDVLVNYVQEQKKTTSVYAMDKQYSANPYELFLDGNHALVDITTASLEDRTLLLIKDSYANCFIPFLLAKYHRIIVVDPRYYYEDIASLLHEYDLHEVLFLYNANTLFEDTSLISLLEEELQN